MLPLKALIYELGIFVGSGSCSQRSLCVYLWLMCQLWSSLHQEALIAILLDCFVFENELQAATCREYWSDFQLEKLDTVELLPIYIVLDLWPFV